MEQTERIVTLNRVELARLLRQKLHTVNSYISRDQVPLLSGLRGRSVMPIFDAWGAVVHDLFARQGGLDATITARAMNGARDKFQKCARRIDAGEEDLVACIALLPNNTGWIDAGTVPEIMSRVRKLRSLRLTFVDLNLAWDLIKINAQEQQIDVGGRISLTDEELAELRAAAAKKAN